MHRTILPKTLGTALVLAVLLAAACDNDIEKIKMLSNRKFPTESGENIEMVYSDSGRVRMKMFAPVVDRYTEERPYTEMKKGMTCYFYNSEGKVENMLKAHYSIRYDQEKKMMARDSVLLQNIKGERLNTEQIFWDESHHRIYSDKFVTIRTADELFYGDGFESNEDFTRYKITHLRGQVRLKEGNATGD